jgi:hypothetical protein
LKDIRNRVRSISEVEIRKINKNLKNGAMKFLNEIFFFASFTIAGTIIAIEITKSTMPVIPVIKVSLSISYLYRISINSKNIL